MAYLMDSRIVKRDTEIIRVTEQQFEECKEANEKGMQYTLEAKDGMTPLQRLGNRNGQAYPLMTIGTIPLNTTQT